MNDNANADFIVWVTIIIMFILAVLVIITLAKQMPAPPVVNIEFNPQDLALNTTELERWMPK